VDTEQKISKVAKWIQKFGGWLEVEKYLKKSKHLHLYGPLFETPDNQKESRAEYADLSF